MIAMHMSKRFDFLCHINDLCLSHWYLIYFVCFFNGYQILIHKFEDLACALM